MAVLLTALLMIVGSLASATAQGQFISIDDDPVLGNPNAKVTIIEFADYQCPYCRQFWRDTLPRIKKAYVDAGNVRLVFRDFPQKLHPEAMVAAIAADCAADQGRYWEFHDKVFREQDRRGREVVRFKVADLKRWGADIGLDSAVFNECIDAERHNDEVSKDYADGAGVGINGTPVFFVNGRVLVGAQPFSNFQKVIEEELRR